MSENKETSSSKRVKEDEFILKRANQANIREEDKEKGTTVKVDLKEDAIPEEWTDTLHIDKRKNKE